MYIVQMKQPFKVNLKEHKTCIKNYDIKHFAIAKHYRYSSHNFKFSKVSMIQKCSSMYNLDF